MKTFTGYQYLLIDVANNFNLNLDKERFEDRISWAESKLTSLELLAESSEWKEKPLYLKAVQALRGAQQGKPTGHLVGLDAVCSGMQIMSAVTGCIKGATATGLVDPDRRADAYTECTGVMGNELGSTVVVDRSQVKNAVMTSLYGSKKEPKKEFGEDTPELNAFYKAMYEIAPGACELLEALVNSWQPYAKAHQWKLPDGFDVRVKVMARKEHRIEVDEAGHSSFTYVYYENDGCKRDVKNAANVIHSIDAYVLRSLVRRCNYDGLRVALVSQAITTSLLSARSARGDLVKLAQEYPAAKYYLEQYDWSGIVDPVILNSLDEGAVELLPVVYLRKLNKLLGTMLDHKPFEIVAVHDDFKAHPNNLNQLRSHYRNILGDLADSSIIEGILSQIHGSHGTYTKMSPTLGNTIRNSNYALC